MLLLLNSFTNLKNMPENLQAGIPCFNQSISTMCQNNINYMYMLNHIIPRYLCPASMFNTLYKTVTVWWWWWWWWWRFVVRHLQIQWIRTMAHYKC